MHPHQNRSEPKVKVATQAVVFANMIVPGLGLLLVSVLVLLISRATSGM